MQSFKRYGNRVLNSLRAEERLIALYRHKGSESEAQFSRAEESGKSEVAELPAVTAGGGFYLGTAQSIKMPFICLQVFWHSKA